MKVRIPTPLHSYTASKSTVDATGATVDAVTRDLERQFGGIRFRIIDEQDQIRPHVKIFLNGDQVRDLATQVAPSDELAIIQAFSGG